MPFFPDPAPPLDVVDACAFHPSSPIVAEWQRFVDAGRLGATTPLAPALLAALRAIEALICRPRRGGVW